MVAMIATNSQLDFEHFERSQVFVRRAPSIRAQGENTHLLDSSEPLIVAGSILSPLFRKNKIFMLSFSN
jgi:hypothetical protein